MKSVIRLWAPPIRSFIYSIARFRLGSVKNNSTTCNIALLDIKKVLEVRGRDAKKLLQGLMTNDVTTMTDGVCMATTFLSPKGRIQADTFLYYSTNVEGEPTILIETNSAHTDALTHLLSLYKLRSNVSITLKPNIKSYFIYGSSLIDQLELAKKSKAIIYAADPRVDGLGVRALYSNDLNNIVTTDSANISYEKYRLVAGLAEGSELSDEIPMECNLDLLRYISFEKGCYIGQELVARTKYKGVVRKRILPFTLRPQLGELTCKRLSLEEAMDLTGPVEETKSPVKCRRVTVQVAGGLESKEVGQIVHFDPTCGVGLVLLRLEVLGDGRGRQQLGPLVTPAGGVETGVATSLTIYPFFPFWWPDKDAVTGRSIIPSDSE